LHQAGARHAETTQAAYRDSGADALRWEVSAFLDDMPRRVEAADLVLARSGASTVAELAAAGKPALLVPFPQAADDHQRKNAEVMVAGGAARMLIQAEMSDEILLATLVDLLRDYSGLEQMGTRAKALAKPNAAADIAAMVVELAGEKCRSEA
jgi:UDP-N-acetylglucosamine--N-acetylmuramyl-(pentapeptide) pyrophosphoryl-undecaprenol N-acetylglucosamine transferase